VLLLLPLVSACSDFGFNKVDPDQPQTEPAPRIRVEPRALDFPLAGGFAGDVTVRNSCSAPLSFFPELHDPGGLQVVVDASRTELAPGEAVGLHVTTAMRTGQGAIWLHSDDPDTPQLEVPLSTVVQDVDTADTGDSTPPCAGVRPGTTQDCPAETCQALLDGWPLAPDDVYWLTLIPDGAVDRFYCDQSRDGGGWLRAAVSSDDGQPTWTWTDRALWTDQVWDFGDVDQRTQDYRGRGLYEAPAADVLFVHAPSGVWADYQELQLHV
jgi:hypothetical protein